VEELLSSIAWPVLVAIGVGGALAVVQSVRLMAWRINTAVFLDMVRRLLSAGNRERAIKLCAAAPSAPVARLAHFVLTLQVPGIDPRAEPARHFREGPAGASTEDRVNASVHAQVVAEQRRVDGVFLPGLVGSLLAASTSLTLIKVPANARVQGALVATAAWVLVIVLMRQRWRFRGDLAQVATALVPYVGRGDPLE
jgi:hypothetical protein